MCEDIQPTRLYNVVNVLRTRKNHNKYTRLVHLTRAVARRVLAGAQHRQEQISAPPVESVTSTPSQHRCLAP